jgi:hypothetical protein
MPTAGRALRAPTTKTATPRAKKNLDALPPELPAEVEARVRREGMVLLGKLTARRLGPSARAELEAALEARGLERTPKSVRIPLAAQLAEAVAAGARVPLKDVSGRVKGGTKPEVASALASIVRDGGAKVVVRTKVDVLVGPAEPTLAPAELDELTAAHAALGDVLRAVAAKGWTRTLLRDDLRALLEPFARFVTAPSRSAADTSAHAIVADALRRLEDRKLKLVRIPDLVRALDGSLPLAAIHRALLDAAESGALELRPEAGSEFLSEEDASLCPVGPRDTVFSYARLVGSGPLP